MNYAQAKETKQGAIHLSTDGLAVDGIAAISKARVVVLYDFIVFYSSDRLVRGGQRCWRVCHFAQD